MSNLDEKQIGYGGSFELTWYNDVAIITFDCGENRWNDYFVTKFNSCLDQVLQKSSARAVITTGKGKFFSNGLDLQWLQLLEKEDPKRLQAFYDRLTKLFKRINTFPVPTVAAINGHAFAAGAMLALCHDYRVMNSERGWFCINEVHIGLRFNKFFSILLRSRLPSGPVYHEAVVLGTRYTAQLALESRIINRTAPRDQLINESILLTKQMFAKNGFNRNHLENSKLDAYRDLQEAIYDSPGAPKPKL